MVMENHVATCEKKLLVHCYTLPTLLHFMWFKTVSHDLELTVKASEFSLYLHPLSLAGSLHHTVQNISYPRL